MQVLMTASKQSQDGTAFHRHFSHPFRPALRSTQPPVQWVPGLSCGVKRPGRGIIHPHYPAQRLKKEWSYISSPHPGLRGLLQDDELYCDRERSVHSVARLRTGRNLLFIVFRLCLQRAYLTVKVSRSLSPGNGYVEFIWNVSV